MIKFEIINPKLISVNDQYIHPVRKTKNGRYTSYVVKAPYLKEVQAYYEEVLKEKITDEQIEKLKNSLISDEDFLGLELKIKLGLPRKEIYQHDMSNYIKAYEDCLSRRLKIDDSRNFVVSIEEQLYETENNDWKLVTEVSAIVLDTMEVNNETK